MTHEIRRSFRAFGFRLLAFLATALKERSHQPIRSPGEIRRMSFKSYDHTHSRLSIVVMLGLVFQPCAALANSPAASPRPMAAPSPATSEFPSPATSEPNAIQVADIALHRSGILQGQVVTAAGGGEANVVVQLTHGRDTWQAKTDSQGWFQLAELRGGTYQFRVGGQEQLIRVWAPGTAPPKASPGILVTPSTDIVRGQHSVSPNTNQFFRVLKRRLANPLIVTGVTLTAVAIPVALHNTDDDDPPATP